MLSENGSKNYFLFFRQWINKNIGGDRSCLPAYTRASKKKKNTGMMGVDAQGVAIDDFLSSWTPSDTSDEDSVTSNNNNKKKKGQGKKRKHQKNKDSDGEDRENTNKRKKGQGNKRKHDRNKLKNANGQENAEDVESAEQNQSQETPSNDEGQNSYTLFVNTPDDSPEGNVADGSAEKSTEDDWSSIPGALMNIAKLISRESHE